MNSINKNEMIYNTDRYPTANIKYYLVYIIDDDNRECIPALFTENEVDKAIERSARNKEDSPFKSYPNFIQRFIKLIFRV